MNAFIYLFLGEKAELELDFLPLLVPRLLPFVIQLLAFIVMVILVFVLAYKPVKKFIQQREEYLKNNLEGAAKKNEEATKYLEEAKESVANSRKEATRLIQEAKKEAEIQREAMLEETKQEIQAKHAKASEDLKKEQEKAIKQVHDEVVDLAIETSKSILGRNVDAKDDKKMIDDLVDELMEKK